MQESPPPEAPPGSSTTSTSHTAAPVRKRQLFKNRSARPAPSSVQKKPPVEDEDEDPLAAFNRSNDTFRLIQEEEARVRKEKDLAAREKAEYERAIQESLAQLHPEPKQKKLRLSEEGEDETGGLYSEGRLASTAPEAESANVNGLTTPPRSRSNGHSTTPRSSARRRGLPIEPEDYGSPLRSRSQPNRVNTHENVHEQRNDSSNDAINTDSYSIPTNPSTQPILLDDSDDPDTHDNDLRSSRAASQSTHLAPPRPTTAAQPRSTQSATPIPEAPSPVLSLLIHSSLPDTTPLMVKRRLNQRLKEVRTAWIKKQQGAGALPTDLDMTTIFLTWRGKRLFDFTTCKSLGVTLDELTGEVVHKSTGGSGMTWREEREWAQAGAGTQMVFEAVTEQILEERRNPERAAAAVSHSASAGIDAKNIDGNDMASERPRLASTNPEQQQDTGIEENIRIVLRAGKEYADYKLTVRKSTHVSKVLAAFRKRHNLPAEKTTVLVFEGDDLDEDDTIGNTDIADLEVVDVRVRDAA